MNKLSKDILYEILSNINKLEWVSLLQSNKFIYQNFINDYIKYKKKKEFIENYYPNKIIALFGGIEEMIKYPILEWNEEYLKKSKSKSQFQISTDKINNPIMLSRDQYDRANIIIKSKIDNRNVIDVLYQKDLYTQETWGNILNDGIMRTSNYFYINDEFCNNFVDVKNLKRYINGEKEIIVYKNYYDPLIGMIQSQINKSISS